jgi:hypothetical protein
MLLEYLYLEYNTITSVTDTDPQRVHLFIYLHILFKLLLNIHPWFCPFPLIVEIFMTEIHQILLRAFYLSQTTFTSVDFLQKLLTTYYFRSY